MSDKAPLRYKVCGWCDQPLEQARKGPCAMLFRAHGKCAWVPLLSAYQPSTALRVVSGETEDWLGVLKDE